MCDEATKDTRVCKVKTKMLLGRENKNSSRQVSCVQRRVPKIDTHSLTLNEDSVLMSNVKPSAHILIN